MVSFNVYVESCTAHTLLTLASIHLSRFAASCCVMLRHASYAGLHRGLTFHKHLQDEERHALNLTPWVGVMPAYRCSVVILFTTCRLVTSSTLAMPDNMANGELAAYILHA